MSRTLHIGVFTDDPDPARLPEGYISDGDSFLEWGEAHPGDSRVPLHLIVDVDGGRDARDVVSDARFVLTERLRSDERLTDYAVLTDPTDWSENVSVVTLEGAVTYDDRSITDLDRRVSQYLAANGY